MSPEDYQFTSPDADVVLLTTEIDRSTEFRVHKCILSAASPFFNDMFLLPQPKGEMELPTIPVPESSEVLDKILRYVYPIPEPEITSLDLLGVVLQAACKYEFQTAVVKLRKQLLTPQFLHVSPLRVYAIACQHEFVEEMQESARHTLKVNLIDDPKKADLELMSAYDFHRLLSFHRRRTNMVLNLLKPPDNIKCMQCNGTVFSMHDAPKWWYQFEQSARLRLTSTPTTEDIFGIEFLFKAAQLSNCSRCPESVLQSWKFLQNLKSSIDDLALVI